ncbi:MAG: T9SS type A sorting domain-containing protein [Bacteroidota bacterium]
MVVAGVASPEASALDLRVSPNPASGAAALRFTLAQPGSVSADVFDARGRRVLSVPERALGAGEGRLGLDLSGLSAGVYSVRFQTPEATETARLSIVR